MNIPVNANENSTLPPASIVDLPLLGQLQHPSHGSMTTNLVYISADLTQDDEQDTPNPWLASPDPELDAEFAARLQQLIVSAQTLACG